MDITNGTSQTAGLSLLGNRGIFGIEDTVTDNTDSITGLTTAVTVANTNIANLETDLTAEAYTRLTNDNTLQTNIDEKLDVSGGTITDALTIRNDTNGDLLRFNGERSWLWYTEGTGGGTSLNLKDEGNGKFWNYKTFDGYTWARWFFVNELPDCYLQILYGKLIMGDDAEIIYKGATLDNRFVNIAGDTMTGDLTVNGNVISSTIPSIDTHLTNKLYVDTADNLKRDLTDESFTNITTDEISVGTGGLQISGNNFVNIDNDVTVQNPQNLYYKGVEISTLWASSDSHTFTDLTVTDSLIYKTQELSDVFDTIVTAGSDEIANRIAGDTALDTAKRDLTNNTFTDLTVATDMGMENDSYTGYSENKLYLKKATNSTYIQHQTGAGSVAGFEFFVNDSVSSVNRVAHFSEDDCVFHKPVTCMGGLTTIDPIVSQDSIHGRRLTYEEDDETEKDVETEVIGLHNRSLSIENNLTNNYPTNSTVASDFVDKTTAQTVAGIKTFSDNILVSGISFGALNTRVTTAESDINTLQGELNTAEGDINTLQGELNTAEGDINTLQSELDTEESTRLTNDNTLQTNIDTEESTRISEDNLKLNLTGGTMTGALILGDNTNDNSYLQFNGERSWLWYPTGSGYTTDLNLKDETGEKYWNLVTSGDTIWARLRFHDTVSSCKLEFLYGNLVMSNDTEITYKSQTLDNRFVNVTDFATNTTNIATNTSGIATNTTNIATNTTNIATNTSGIATNTSGIATNTTNIATNTSGIATNTSGIATNVTGIATNLNSIGWLTTAIATNTSAIADETTARITNDNLKLNLTGGTMTNTLILGDNTNTHSFLQFNGERSWLWYSANSGSSTDLNLKDEGNGKYWNLVTNDDTTWARWFFSNTLSACKLEILGGRIVMSNDTEIIYKDETLDDRFVNVAGGTITGDLTVDNNLEVEDSVLVTNSVTAKDYKTHGGYPLITQVHSFIQPEVNPLYDGQFCIHATPYDANSTSGVLGIKSVVPIIPYAISVSADGDAEALTNLSFQIRARTNTDNVADITYAGTSLYGSAVMLGMEENVAKMVLFTSGVGVIQADRSWGLYLDDLSPNGYDGELTIKVYFYQGGLAIA